MFSLERPWNIYQVPVSATVFSFYIFTFLMFRKLNKPQLTKIKQQNFIGIRAFDSRKVFQFSQMLTCGLSDLSNW
jgi:hypothetical protein